MGSRVSSETYRYCDGCGMQVDDLPLKYQLSVYQIPTPTGIADTSRLLGTQQIDAHNEECLRAALAKIGAQIIRLTDDWLVQFGKEAVQ